MNRHQSIAAVLTALLLALPALTARAEPQSVQERTAAQHDRQRAQRAHERGQREERAQVRQAKRSAKDLGLSGRARTRYVDLHRK
jgi:hypothetical protein